MSNKGATFAKRQREIARQEKARGKASRRLVRKESRGKEDVGGGEDPDIAGIVPGPQPLPYDLLDEPPTEKEEHK